MVPERLSREVVPGYIPPGVPLGLYMALYTSPGLCPGLHLARCPAGHQHGLAARRRLVFSVDLLGSVLRAQPG